MKVLEVTPFASECDGRIDVPGSKSISNRALILAALCETEVKLQGMLESEDVSLMKEALISLGVSVQSGQDSSTLTVRGCGGRFPVKNQRIEVGNAGTVARFLTALLALQKDGTYHLDGSDAMRVRPMKELLTALEKGGCRFEFAGKEGFFPFTMRTRGLSQGDFEVDASQSSQVLSALLMIAPMVSEYTKVRYPGGTVSEPFVDITLGMMRSFSENLDFSYEYRQNQVSITSKGYHSGDSLVYSVEPDATAASYFMTLPVSIGGTCEVEGISDSMLQGDADYGEVLRKIGMKVDFSENGVKTENKGGLKGGAFDFNSISDTFLSLAAVSPLLDQPISIRGISHTRKQETDRVSAMAIELNRLGQTVEESNDQLKVIQNLQRLKELARDGIEVETYHDHRFAMSFAILGCHDLLGDGSAWLRIKNPNCCSKTFPNFFQKLDKLRKQAQ